MWFLLLIAAFGKLMLLYPSDLHLQLLKHSQAISLRLDTKLFPLQFWWPAIQTLIQVVGELIASDAPAEPPPASSPPPHAAMPAAEEIGTEDDDLRLGMFTLVTAGQSHVLQPLQVLVTVSALPSLFSHVFGSKSEGKVQYEYAIRWRYPLERQVAVISLKVSKSPFIILLDIPLGVSYIR